MHERHGHTLKQELIVGLGTLVATGAIVGATFYFEDKNSSSDVNDQTNGKEARCLWDNSKERLVCSLSIIIPKECIDWATKSLEKDHGMEISNPSAPDERPLSCGNEETINP